MSDPRRKPAVAPSVIFAALGDETRLAIVRRLAGGGPASISTLTAEGQVTRQAVSKHLGVLESAGLIRGCRRGRERIWQLEAKQLAALREAVARIERSWDSALERLKTLVEDNG